MIYVPDAQAAFEEREAFVMRRPTGWPIIRVLTGQPLKIADAINAMQVNGNPVTEAYCPRETVKRRHPGVSSTHRKQIDHTRPLVPGYVFVRKEFDLDSLLPAMLTQHKLESPHKPRTIALRVRWLTFKGNYVRLSDRAVAALHESEKAYRPDLGDIIAALREIARGAMPTKFLSFEGLSTLANAQRCDISRAGRAA